MHNFIFIIVAETIKILPFVWWIFEHLRYKSWFLIDPSGFERKRESCPDDLRVAVSFGGAAGTQLQPVPYSHRELGRSITEISRRDVGTERRVNRLAASVCVCTCYALRTLCLMKQLDWPGLLLRRCRLSFRERKIRCTSYDYRSLMLIIAFLLDRYSLI